jgi:hypothetical protein
MAEKAYYIQSGNWCLKLHQNIKSFDTPHDCYVEMATQAMELVFGDKDFSNPLDDYYAIMNENNVNVLDTDDCDVIPTFTTGIHILSSKKGEPHQLLTTLRTYDIFANAGQWQNAEYALTAENLEKNK